MRLPTLIVLCLGAGLAACSDADDLGRAVGEGPIQGRLLDDHDHCDEAHDDCDEDHEPCDEDHEHDPDGDCDGEPGEEQVAAGSPAAGVQVEAPVGSPSPEPAPESTPEVPALAPLAVAAQSPAQPAVGSANPGPAAPARPGRPRGGFDPSAYTWIDFDPMIEFDYPELVRVDGDTPPPELPAEVKALHGKQVAIEGFMSPLAFDAGGVKEFSLVKDPSFCCFGMIPQMNHWIHVVMPEGQRTEFYSFDPIAVYGVLEVGEQYEDGYVVSLYRMVADKVEGDF